MIKRFFLIWLAGLLWAVGSTAQEPIRKKQFNVIEGPALQGYDPVGYSNQGKAIKGQREFALNHQGITYYFASAENRLLFKNDPGKYEPEYGGWCAFAMGDTGEKVSIDPATFKVVNGKLYLFYNKFFTNTLPSWNKREPALKANADNNWAKIFR